MDVLRKFSRARDKTWRQIITFIKKIFIYLLFFYKKIRIKYCINTQRENELDEVQDSNKHFLLDPSGGQVPRLPPYAGAIRYI